VDAIDLLREQHRDIESLLTRLPTLPPDEQRRELEIVADVIDLHLRVEDRHLYPLVCELSLEEADDETGAEHGRIERVLDELRGTAPDEGRFGLLLQRLRDELGAHCRREDERLFPAVARALSGRVRRALGQTMMETIAERENEDWIGTPRVELGW
jgi:hemerythrin-like domain-containing protein